MVSVNRMVYILSVPVYHILWNTHKELCVKFLPEGNSIVAALFTGWLHGLIISGLAVLSRKLMLRYWPSVLEKKEKQVIIESKIGPKAR